ncbi:hypothetical protein LY78DRAFT_277091 [Colletotrichum sublineola]|nr:hypothetical protein LY78DRAFT_277091 [Colletotrichum sublineola]
MDVQGSCPPPPPFNSQGMEKGEVDRGLERLKCPRLPGWHCTKKKKNPRALVAFSPAILGTRRKKKKKKKEEKGTNERKAETNCCVILSSWNLLVHPATFFRYYLPITFFYFCFLFLVFPLHTSPPCCRRRGWDIVPFSYYFIPVVHPPSNPPLLVVGCHTAATRQTNDGFPLAGDLIWGSHSAR